MSNGIGPYKNKFREVLFKQQEGLCFHCNQPMSLTNRKRNGQPARDFATFEHLKRRQQGGKVDSTNIVLMHYKCNRKKNREFQAEPNEQTILSIQKEAQA